MGEKGRVSQMRFAFETPYIKQRHSFIRTVAETIDFALTFIIGYPMLRTHDCCSRKISCMLALQIPMLR